MRVCLVSSDRDLCDLIAEIAGTGFFNLLPGEELGEAELYLFDFEPDSGFPRLDRLNPANHLFLVDPSDLGAFGQHLRSKPASILLKPVDRAALEAVLNSRRQPVSQAEEPGAEVFRSDRDELLQHLLQANLKLQEHEQERTNFLARALHDLRTPLTSLRGVCGLLLEGEVGPLNPQQRELLQRMQNSSGRLARLSSGMFELSVQGRVQRTLQLEPGNIENCVKQSLHEIRGFVQEKQLRVESHVTPPPKTMFMESPQIEQVLINLLENACRFTPRLGEIEIHGYAVYWDFEHLIPKSSTEFPNAYRIDIRDSGPGIEPSMLEGVFEQYTSVAGANDRSGGGLGLAICKLAVTAHGGRIWAASSKVGAMFSLVLPFDPRIAAGSVRRLREESRPRSAQAV